MTELFLAGGLKVIVHCGAQSTAETVELASTQPRRASTGSR